MASIWDSVVGQGRAVEQLQHAAVSPVHAYLLVGTEGCGKEEASRAFAAMLLSGSDDPTERINEMAMRGAHPDVHEVRR
ncbi:MAG: DNA polymerase III subunit delta', partial [Actinomycetes bacterium]